MTDAKRLQHEARREKQASRKKEGWDAGSIRLCVLDKAAVRTGKTPPPSQEVEPVLRDLDIAIKAIRVQQ